MRPEYIFVGLSIVGVCVIGIVETLSEIRRLEKRIDFTNEYLTRFDHAAAKLLSRQRDINPSVKEEYTWLLENVEKIHSEIGGSGVLALYTLPPGQYTFQNYCLFVNILPNLRSGEADRSMVGLCVDALIKHRGVLNHYWESVKNDLRNPLAWLQRGVQLIISFPFRLFMWCGLLSYETFVRVRASSFVKFVGGLFTLFGIVSAFFSVVSGWDSTMTFLRRLLHL